MKNPVQGEKTQNTPWKFVIAYGYKRYVVLGLNQQDPNLKIPLKNLNLNLAGRLIKV